MYTYRVIFSFGGANLREQISELAHSFLGALRLNGQICGAEWALALAGNSCTSYVLAPEKNSLAKRFDNKYVAQARQTILAAGIHMSTRLIGEDCDGTAPCTCVHPSGYILFTTYITLESPLRCLDCFRPIALYRLGTNAEEFSNIISWQSNYQACDRLQMNCQVLEQESIAQLGDFSSQLSIQGRTICQQLTQNSQRPVFYYLYRNVEGQSIEAESKDLCPSCSDPWILPKTLHKIFNFKCDRCNLLSNISFNLTMGLDPFPL